MRLLLWLLLAAFLLVTGLWPSIAAAAGGALGLIFAGGLQLLSQPPVLGLALALLILTAFRRPRTAA